MVPSPEGVALAFPVPLNQGDRIYKYELLQRLGSGNFGEVWLARDVAIEAEVAVKVLDATTTQVADVLREAQIGNLARHPNLVQINGADVVNIANHQAVLVAMAYHPRGSAASIANAANFVPLNVALSLISGVLRGLEFLPEIGILHNDIKPQNILVGDDGRGILADYGISARAPGGNPVAPPDAYFPHISPETLQRGEIDLRTEVYQAGLSACRLINGLGLIDARLAALGGAGFERAVLDGEVVRTSDFLPFVPRRLKTVLRRAINPDSARRYQSPLDFRRALERLHFPGSWSVDGNGAYRGEDNLREYRFERLARTARTSDFLAHGKSKATGRETRVGKFCGTRLSASELKAAESKFMQAVVEGNV